MKVYHGTSMENLINMIKGRKSPKVWSVSDSDVIYVYAKGKYDIERAFDSAILCAAIQKSVYNKVAVLEFNIDEDKLSIDKSDGMEFIDDTRWCISQAYFMHIFAECKVRYFEYNPDLRWMYLYNLYHSCCCLNWELAKDQVVDVHEIIDKCDKWCEENNEYEWHFRDQLPPECKEVFIDDVLGISKLTEGETNMEEKVLIAGLNTILYTHNGKENIDQFILSLKFKDGISDYTAVIDIDDKKFTYDDIAREAMVAAEEGIVLIALLEIVDNKDCKYVSKLKNPKENLGLFESSHVVLEHSSIYDHFIVLKHRSNKDLCNKIVNYSDLI